MLVVLYGGSFRSWGGDAARWSGRLAQFGKSFQMQLLWQSSLPEDPS
jgi:hypothetical protein